MASSFFSLLNPLTFANRLPRNVGNTGSHLQLRYAIRSSRDYQSSRSWSYKLHLRAFYLSQVCALCFDQVETLRRFSFLSDVEESPVTDRRQNAANHYSKENPDLRRGLRECRMAFCFLLRLWVPNPPDPNKHPREGVAVIARALSLLRNAL